MRSRILLCAMALLAGCAAAEVPRTKRYTASTNAMQPALKAGQTFVARVVAPGTYKPTPGDVVVFRNPEAWGSPGNESVKRVVAVEGFVIACCDVEGRVTVDGVALDEPYLGEDSPIDAEPVATQCLSRRFGPVTVEPGHVFVMGDSRGVSMDSRCLGTVPNDRVIGVLTETG
ncbi:signal peptidase I [Dactylosporangium sp. NPDC050688]|uniref:signal peptidase I n=1 Tax=Dactylosporangium sp. NPDC050688 TaxID=3157217 RepID=UPI0034071DB3